MTLSSIKKLLDRLPSHFKKSVDSNNYKLLSIIARQSEDNTALYNAIQRFWDVDQAEGIGLDRLGKDEGISRGSYDDDTYRKLIKVQYIVNLSEGDIESINAVLRAYMGDDFIGIREGWNSRYQEPASFIVEMLPSINETPFQLINKMKAVAVKVFFVNIVSTKKYYSMASLFGETTTLYPWSSKEININIQSPMGTSFQSIETFTVYPQ